MNDRAGRYIVQLEGYKAFKPNPLPSFSDLKIDSEMISLLSEADRNLGRLDGITRTLPNPQLFVSMYVKKEALLSSQIEGTQASLIEILQAEKHQTADAREVSNYVLALTYGIERLESFPLSLRLIREIHAKLLASGRGSNRNPGQFRRTQNWIGNPGCTLQNAAFVPPALDDMMQALNDLENCFYTEDDMPPLIKIALIHAQFETIHPFLDGNGRMGRLLITFWLYQQKILSQPLLYLSYYFKRNRAEYYDRLMAVRMQGDWEQWVKFFLKGIIEISKESTESAIQIDELRTTLTDIINNSRNMNIANARNLLDLLFLTPTISRTSASASLGVSAPTAGYLIRAFEDLGILTDTEPERQRNKTYVFQPYLDILEVGTD